MKITVQSTSKIVILNGIPVRIWEGTTENGIPMHAYITTVAVSDKLDTSEFEKSLLEHVPPSPELQAIPLRMDFIIKTSL